MNSLFGEEEEEVAANGNPSAVAEVTVPRLPFAEVREASYAGGNRGIFATCDLGTGSLVLAEVPIMAWVDCDLFSFDNLAAALRSVCADRLTADASKFLHPVALNHADPFEVDRARESLGSDLISSISAEYGMDINEIVRIFLVLQHNGFESGFYKYLCLINHSCDPNCIKFSPTQGTMGASQVWTTRFVPKGQELTICYCTPLEMPKQHMLEFLKTHHRFACACNACLLPSNISTRSADGDDFFIEEYVQSIVSIEKELLWQHAEDNLNNLKMYPAMLLKLQMILSDESMEKVMINCVESDKVRLWSRGHQCIVDVSRRALETMDRMNNDAAHDGRVFKLQMKSKYLSNIDEKEAENISVVDFCSQTFLTHSVLLWDLQTKYLGNEHPSVATTLLDIADALQLLLDRETDSKAAVTDYLRQLLQKMHFLSLGDVQLSRKYLKGSILKQIRTEGDRVKKLYSTFARFPSVVDMGRSPGSIFWGYDS
jgi:hypothetical protein